jgi:hypothetical protein
LLPLVLFAGGGIFYETTTMIRDRAEVVTVTLMQIVSSSSTAQVLQHRIQTVLHDEFRDIERQAVVDRNDDA